MNACASLLTIICLATQLGASGSPSGGGTPLPGLPATGVAPGVLADGAAPPAGTGAVATPQATLPQAASPQVAAPQASAPQVAAPQGSVPALPVPPTDPVLQPGAASQPPLPAAATPPTAYGTARPQGTLPESPLATPGEQPYADYLTQQAAGRVPRFNTAVGAAPRAAPTKPFADYTPSPVYSPYMNLYRDNGRYGTALNNYYSWVLPMQNQSRQNQQFRTDIRGLEGASRQQQNTLQSIEQRQPSASASGGRTSTPSRFMDLRGYYPGLR